MVTVFETGRMAYRQAFTLNTIATAAFLILLFHPTDLWSVSFQLSFTATAAIMIIARRCEPLLHRREWQKSPVGRAVAWIVGTIVISVAAQLGTLPLTMFYFHQISNYFLLTNLIVLPVATFLVPCGLATVALGGTPVGLIIGKITHYLAWLMNHAVEWIENLPGSTAYVEINLPMVFLYYALLLGFLILWSLKRKKKHVSTNKFA
jgi:competence protein ComEC